MADFPQKGRGTKGVIAMATTARNGSLVGAEQVFLGDEIMLISDAGTAVRTRVDEISVLGRNTQGVRVIRTREDEHLVSVSRIAEDDASELVTTTTAPEVGNEPTASETNEPIDSTDGAADDEV
jgi:DNA gyrase subunit A